MRRLNLVTRGLAGALVIAAVSFPSAALAKYGPDVPGRAGVLAPIVTAPSVGSGGARAPSAFDWGDAGIGAGATIVLLGAGAAASGTARKRRVHRAVTG